MAMSTLESKETALNPKERLHGYPEGSQNVDFFDCEINDKQLDEMEERFVKENSSVFQERGPGTGDPNGSGSGILPITGMQLAGRNENQVGNL